MSFSLSSIKEGVFQRQWTHSMIIEWRLFLYFTIDKNIIMPILVDHK
jgi:hypothetical protein